MALIPVFTIALTYPAQRSLIFEDVTSDYNEDTAPGGYGDPNIEKSEVTSTKIYAKREEEEEYTQITVTYLPTGDPVTITCDDYIPVDEDEAEDEDCVICAPGIGDTDCNPVAATCFTDGCWNFKYEVFVGVTLIATTITDQFLYGQTQARFTALGKQYFDGACNNCMNGDFIKSLNDARNDFEELLFVARTDGCDCSCVSSGLASVEKQLSILENNC